MNVEQIISPTPDLLMIIIAVRNPKINDEIWKPFIKIKEFIHKDYTLDDVYKIVKNNHPTWQSFFWRNLEIKKD